MEWMPAFLSGKFQSMFENQMQLNLIPCNCDIIRQLNSKLHGMPKYATPITFGYNLVLLHLPQPRMIPKHLLLFLKQQTKLTQFNFLVNGKPPCCNMYIQNRYNYSQSDVGSNQMWDINALKSQGYSSLSFSSHCLTPVAHCTTGGDRTRLDHRDMDNHGQSGQCAFTDDKNLASFQAHRLSTELLKVWHRFTATTARYSTNVASWGGEAVLQVRVVQCILMCRPV